MAKLGVQANEISRSVTRWALLVALAFTVVYAAAAIVFSNVASAPLADTIAELTAPWQYVSAEDVDDMTHEKYADTIERAKVDVVRQYMSSVAAISNDGRFEVGRFYGPLYDSRAEALAAGGSAADRVVLMPAEEIYALADHASDVRKLISANVQASVRSADDVEIDASVYAAAAVALARAEDFAQARERDMALGSDLVFDDYPPITAWMQDIMRVALDLRNAGVAGSFGDGIYRATYAWYDDWALIDSYYEELCALGVYQDMSGYVVDAKADSRGIVYERYFGDGHEEVRDLAWYNYLRGLREPLFVIGWLVGLLVIARLATRKSLEYFDKLSSALSDVAAGEVSTVDKLPDELAATRRTMQDIARREDVARREAQLTERGKNELVAYLAHDTKTPLTSVIGYLSILSEEPDLPQGQRERYLSAALEKAYRLDGMIDEFFEIARFNITALSIERAGCDPAVLCYQVAGELLPAADVRDITIDVQAEEGQRAFIDAPQLSRALSNVVKNAVAYADEGTTVTVALRMEAADAMAGARGQGAAVGSFGQGVAADARAEGFGADLPAEGTPANLPRAGTAVDALGRDAAAGEPAGRAAAGEPAGRAAPDELPMSAVSRMRITVTNQGSEISDDHLERIFEKFYREDSARATERGGAGLGLAIAREIVQAHGGTIAATSHTGNTVFTIEVPTGV